MSRDFARRLRRNATDAECRLWSALRRRQLAGWRFRRQQPLGRYIVDFVCLEARLIIEVDGGQHAEQEAEDNERTRWLEAQGFSVMRVWNIEVLHDPDAVGEAIYEASTASPFLTFPRKGGRNP